MRYRRLNTGKEPDVVLRKIAKWHNLTPKLWAPEYKMTEQDIQESIDRINNTSEDDMYIAVAEDEQSELYGFIWAVRQETPENSIMILSLYVVEEYRKTGVATQLKKNLEKWCRQEDINDIETTVHYTNDKMIELNKKLGYEPRMVKMTKRLND